MCRMFKQIITLSVFLLLTSCLSLKPNLRVSQLSYCAPPGPYTYDSSYIPLPDISQILQKNSSLLKYFSYQDILLANASGSMFLLEDLVRLKEIKTDEEDSLLFLMLKKQQIFNRLLLASTEVASIAAELDCESERSKQLAAYLDQINDTRTQQLTILSVVTGAATGIGTAFAQKRDAQISIGVSGSIISAIFGGWASISSRDKVLFNHYRNLLSDIWHEPKKSTVYPPFVWFVLNTKEFSNGEKSTVQFLKERWISEELFDVSKKSKIDLLFGVGGKYLSNELHSRTSMLNQLKAEIRSINQNLQSLMLKLTV